MDYCTVCGKDGKVVNHHINYKENKTIKVCPTCHRRIHTNPKYSALKPVDSSGYTMIQIKKKTAQALKQTSNIKFGDSYDSILVRLIEEDKKSGR
jgi:ribosome-binding protein aMBF1 (putative translation factor)